MSTDYEKLEENIEGIYMKSEAKVIEVFKGHFNFIRNLRKFVTSEFSLLEKQILRSSVYACLLFIVADTLSYFFLDIKTVIPTYIKLIVLIILIALKERLTLKRILKL